MGKVHKQLRFIQILLSGSVSLISLLVLCVKLGKSLDFCSGNAFLCEMAPSTAMIVFLISTAHFLKNVLPDSKILIWFTRTLCLLITAYSISVLLHILGLLPWHPEDLLKLRHYRQTGLYFGAMSPITAFIFMLGAISLQLQNTASEDDRRNRQVSVVFSSISLVISLIVLLGYMTGVPLLPILYRVPMVYLTSLCLTTLSLSILLGSGIDVFPHKLFISSSEGIDRTIQVYNSGLLMVFLGICIFVALIAALYLRIEANTFNKSIREQLNSIADLKTEQIRGWISEVHSYARYIGEDHILHNFIYHIVHERSDPQQSKTLHDSFQRIIKNLPYRSISLLDRSGRCLISYPDNVKYRDVDQIESFRKSFAMKSIIYEDILIDDRTTEGLERNQTLRIWIPVYHNLVEKDEVCATILIQIDPHDNLYPLIQTWPTPSITAETLLVRKEGESVLFLNELRHRSDTALNLSMKLSENPFLLATQAVKGAHGNIEGEDYRKHSVLGAIRYLEVYPWYLIAKIDRAEVMSPLVFKAWTTILILLVLLVSAAVTIEQINRKRTNAENLKVANEWRATFDAVQDVIWLMDKDSRIIRSNKAAETMLGLSSQLLLGDRCWQIVHKSDSPPANCPTQQLMQTGKHTDEELIIEDKWYQISVDPIFGENRNITGMVHIIRDITERKIAEKSLYETNSYLQNLLNHANAPIIVWNTEFTITQFNHAFERLIGQNAENYIGRHLEILFPKESSMESMRKILDTLTGEYWDSVEIPVLTIDGSIRTILWNSANIYDPDGITHVATIAQGQDITERIQAEQEIKDREARLQVIIDAAPFGAHTFELTEDDRLVLISSNESSDLILGIDTQALIGKELLEAFPGNANTPIPDVYRKVARGGENFNTEQVLYNSGAISGAFEVHAMNIGKNKVAVFFMDVTERKKHEAEIQALNESLEQKVLERTRDLEIANGELEAFSYSVSHDLRAPLRGIDGWSQVLIEDCPDLLNETALQSLDKIRSETQRMGQLIDALLNFSRMTRSEIQKETVDLSALATKVCDRLLLDHKSRIIRLDISPGLLTNADPRLMEIVLTNLFSNAFKFSNLCPEAHIEFGSREQDGRQIFFVRDNGAGFNMQYARKLFGTFQRLHKTTEFEGIGIGLATVKRIITRHGGEIQAESEPGKGATFSFYLS